MKATFSLGNRAFADVRSEHLWNYMCMVIKNKVNSNYGDYNSFYYIMLLFTVITTESNKTIKQKVASPTNVS